ncbi:MAG: fatty acid desaturase, partial [Bacteroidota bacterium]|nr:fatty acid desaturase [Bacteroidota bacterium]
IGVDIKSYRKIHWQHHLHLATPADTENSYSHPLTAPFIFETLTGIHLLRVITNKNNKQLLGKTLVKKSVYMLLTGFLINFTILFFSVYNDYWQFAIIWMSALIIFFPFFATIRQIMEHRDELAFKEADFYKSPKNKISRLFSNSLFSRLLGPAGFNKHMIHHWDPQLPFTALKRAEKFLLQCQRTRHIIESSQTTYLSVFKKLLFTH